MTEVSITGSGGFVVGGTVSHTRERTETPAGGFVVSGSAEQSKYATFISEGDGIVFGGSATAYKEYIHDAQGGFVIEGSAPWHKERIVHAVGGMVVQGTAVQTKELLFTPSSGMVVQGAAVQAKELLFTPEAGVVVRGGAEIATGAEIAFTAVQPEAGVYAMPEFKQYKPLYSSDDPSINGGYQTRHVVEKGISNILPPISDEQRRTGCTIWRKIFWRNSTPSVSNLLSCRIHMSRQPANDTHISICEAGYYDVENDIQKSVVREYASGTLLTSIVPGQTTVIEVQLKPGAPRTFYTHDAITIFSADQEVHAPDIQVIQVLDNIAELQLSSPLLTAFEPGATVASVYEVGDVYAHVDKYAVRTENGVFDSVMYPIVAQNTGSIDDEWELVFVDNDGNFELRNKNASCAILFTGNTAQNAQPINYTLNAPILNIDKRGWQGTWVAGDKLMFRTCAPCVPLWIKCVVPSQTNSAHSVFNHVITGRA